MPTLDELWREQQRLGRARPAKRTRTKRTPADHEAALVGRLRMAYGNGPDFATCGECVHLYAVSYANTYFKCRQGPQSKCTATDWRKRWAACGKFEPKEPTP